MTDTGSDDAQGAAASPGPAPGRGRQVAPVIGAVVAVTVLIVAVLLVTRGDGDPAAETGADGTETAELPELACGTDETPDAEVQVSTCNARGTLADDVAIVDESAVEIVELDRAGTSVLTIAADTPALDEVVVTTTPEGPLYGRVVAVDGTTVTTEAATLMDVYPDLDLELTVDDTAATTELEDQLDRAFEPVSTGGDAAVATLISTSQQGPSTTQRAAKRSTKSKKTKLPCTGDVSELELGLEPSMPAPRFDIRANWTLQRGVTAEITYQQPMSIAVDAEIAGSVRCEVRKDLFTLALPRIVFAIGPVPVEITHELGLEFAARLTAEGESSIDVGVSADPLVGVSLVDGTFSPVTRGGLHPVGDQASNGGARVIAHVGLPVHYEAALYGVLGFRPEVEPGLDLTLAPGQDTWLSLDAGVEGSLNVFVDVSKKIPFGPKRYTKTLTRFPVVAPQNLWHLTGGASTTTTTQGSTTTTTTAEVPETTTSTEAPPPTEPPGCDDGDEQCELDEAAARWQARAGEAYALRTDIDGEGVATTCVTGVAGDAGSVRDALDEPGCPADAQPGGLGVEGWYSELQRFIDQGILASATYDPVTGRPTTARIAGGDGATIRWSWL